jgi:hypothetical protein
MAKRLTPGQKAARTKRRKAAAAKAVRTRTAKRAGRTAAQTRKRNAMIDAAKSGLQALDSGDAAKARESLEAILKLLGPAT